MLRVRKGSTVFGGNGGKMQWLVGKGVCVNHGLRGFRRRGWRAALEEIAPTGGIAVCSVDLSDVLLQMDL